MRKIEITLADRDIGSTAKVTERKWFSKVETEYICVASCKIGGCRWVDSKTGASAHWILEIEINSMARNTFLLAKVKGTLPLPIQTAAPAR